MASHRLHLANVAVATLAGACYLPSLRNQFAFDDRSVCYHQLHPHLACAPMCSVCSLPAVYVQAIEENMDLRPQTPLSKLMEHDFWGTPLRSNLSNKSFRPLTVLSFRMNYSMHELDPFGKTFVRF